MASLIENFIQILNQEDVEYRQLLELSRRKTPVIVKGDTDKLSEITEEEQVVVDRISHLEKNRMITLQDIATVLNKDVQTLKIPELIRLLSKQTEVCDQLKDVHDRLKRTLDEMVKVNDQNRNLIQLSLDMVEFDMNLIQAMRQGPETGDYNNRGGYSDAGITGGQATRFDAKQ